MYTGNKTTYILLERGIEDVQLLNEINKIIGSSLFQVGSLKSNFAPIRYAIAIKFLSLR